MHGAATVDAARMPSPDVSHLPVPAALAALLRATAEGVVFQDARGRIVATNPRADQILGFAEAELHGQTSADRAGETLRQDGSPFPADEHPAMVTLATGEPQHDVVMGVRRPGGEVRWISIASEPVLEQGRIVGVVTAFTDFTDRQRLLELLRAQALTDSLTGLANRRAFDDRLSTELSRARRQGDAVVLALLDIDRFKELNDRHGHPEGDRALTRVAQVVRDGVRAEDHVARLAGDEFAVVLPATEEAEAQEVISRVVDAIAEDEVLRALGATVSAGLAEADLGDGARREAATGVDADTLYRRADAALYASKRRGGGPAAR